MQASGVAFGALIYTAAALRGWEVLPPPPGATKAQLMVIFPAAFFAFSMALPLLAPPLRRLLRRYVWMSFAAGFGQTVVSVIGGLGVLGVAAFFIFLQINGVEGGGRYPAGIFSAYAAGVGVLAAQLVLCLRLEREPDVRRLIERG
jgi:hypothetical protein